MRLHPLKSEATRCDVNTFHAVWPLGSGWGGLNTTLCLCIRTVNEIQGVMDILTGVGVLYAVHICKPKRVIHVPYITRDYSLTI